MSTGALAGRLRRVDEGRARLQTQLIGALNHRLVGELHTVARLAPERDRRAASGWLRFTGQVGRIAISPLLVDGAVAHIAGPRGELDAVAAAALLGPIEPLVAALETALGGELHPAGLSHTVEPDQLFIRIDAGAQPSRVQTRLLVALPPGAALADDALPAPPLDPAAVARVRMAWRATIAGPAVPARALATLAPRDMIVLGVAPLQVALGWQAGGGDLLAHMDFSQRKLIVQENATLPSDDDAADTPAPSAAAPPPPGAPALAAELGDVPVRLSFAFDGSNLPAGDVATLGEGSVLPLPAAGQTLAVRIMSGGAVIGAGELVALGEGFGVIVTRVGGAEAR